MSPVFSSAFSRRASKCRAFPEECRGPANSQMVAEPREGSPHGQWGYLVTGMVRLQAATSARG